MLYRARVGVANILQGNAVRESCACRATIRSGARGPSAGGYRSVITGS
jgi:hypothetical protein